MNAMLLSQMQFQIVTPRAAKVAEFTMELDAGRFLARRTEATAAAATVGVVRCVVRGVIRVAIAIVACGMTVIALRFAAAAAYAAVEQIGQLKGGCCR